MAHPIFAGLIPFGSQKDYPGPANRIKRTSAF
jgi:hypothetical protein